MTAGSWILALGLFAPQDLDEAMADLERAIREADVESARAAAEAAVRRQGKAAAEALLGALGRVVQAKLDLMAGREDAKTLPDRMRDRYHQARDLYNDARTDARNNPDDAAKQARARELKNASDRARREWTESRDAPQQHERRIGRMDEIREAIIAAMGDLDDKEAVDLLLRKLRKDKDWATRAGAGAALGRIRRDGVLQELRALLKQEPEATVRMAIVDALVPRGERNAAVVRLLADALLDPAWQIPASALAAIVELELLEMIDALIERMRTAEGRLLFDLQEALAALTGVDKGVSPDAWKAWFDRNREAVLSGAYRPRDDERNGAAGPMTTFFGIPVKSKRVVFVLDRSGSMARPTDHVPEIGTGAGVPEELERPAGDRKIDIARWQLKRVLHLLPEGTRFNIVFYSDTFEVFKPEMAGLDKDVRTEACEWIDRVEPNGGTNVFDSLERAMRFAMTGDGRIDPEGADTVYLLSDGLPNAGRLTRPEDILREVTNLNRTLKLEIHTIWVESPDAGGAGADEGAAFMEKLARDNGGRFVATSPKLRERMR